MNQLSTSTLNAHTERVVLNALDPAALADFYQHIGLVLINQTGDHYQLGTSQGHNLVEIQKALSEREKATGLYHLALLLPERKNLGTIFKYLQSAPVELVGFADHGYSEAIYLNDAEGNGIEIYWDKPQSEWDIAPDGSISGVVEPIDGRGLLAIAADQYERIPDETVMGHVHLHVRDLEETQHFYHDIFGLGVKHQMGSSAPFMASGDYHHHLGSNIWNGRRLPAPDKGQQGMAEVVWRVEDQASLDQLADRLAANQVSY